MGKSRTLAQFSCLAVGAAKLGLFESHVVNPEALARSLLWFSNPHGSHDAWIPTVQTLPLPVSEQEQEESVRHNPRIICNNGFSVEMV